MIRKLARPMLASVFIADGVDTLMNQKDHQEGARDLIARVRSITPNAYIKYLPTSEKALVQASAGTKVAAGSLYALGKAPRLAATALTVTQVTTILSRHAFWETQDKAEKKARRTGFLTDLGLLGGLFLATADTAGKPGLAWRANKAGQQANKKIQAALPTRSEAEKRTEAVTESLKAAGETAKEKAEAARVGAVAAAGTTAAYVEDNKDDWRDKAVETFETAKSFVEDNKDDWQEKASELAAEATDKVKALTADASKQTESFRKDAKKQSKALRKSAAKQTKSLRKDAKKQSKALRKSANKVADQALAKVK